MMWTLTLEGGPPFEFQIGSNPPVFHEGLTITHLFLSHEEAGALKGLALTRGVRLVIRPMEGQTPSQEEERLARATALTIADFPCLRCPECAWSEPFQEEKCGLKTLPEESVSVLLETSSKHREDKEQCPLGSSPAS